MPAFLAGRGHGFLGGVWGHLRGVPLLIQPTPVPRARMKHPDRRDADLGAAAGEALAERQDQDERQGRDGRDQPGVGERQPLIRSSSSRSIVRRLR